MGEGGIKVIPDFCLKGLRKLCNKKKILLILDEVQCGIGRSGKFFAFEYAKIKPDIVPIAKGIGGGFPIGAVLVNKKVASGMKPGTHGSTFGGNPNACSVALAVMDQIFKKGFLKDVETKSKYFFKELNKISCHTVSHWTVPNNINEFISSNISRSGSSSKQLMLGMLNLLPTLPITPKGPSG